MMRAQSGAGGGSDVRLPFSGTAMTASDGDHNVEYWCTASEPVVITIPQNIGVPFWRCTFWQTTTLGKVRVAFSGDATGISPQDTEDADHRYTAGVGCAITLTMLQNVDGESAEFYINGETDFE